MAAEVLYRLPYAREYVHLVQRQGAPEELASVTELNGRRGFVFAPFAIAEQTPVLLMHPDDELRVAVPLADEDSSSEEYTPAEILPADSLLRRRYAIDFANFHAQLEKGAFRKIVLARQAEMTTGGKPDAEALFLRACRRYPRLFVALVSMPKSGTWLMATPETLLEGNGQQWRTMALAGTMRLTGEQLAFDSPLGNNTVPIVWSTKDIQEQRYVSTYLIECLERYTRDFSEEGPYSVRAGDLVHLRSDFTFTLEQPDRLGSLLETLHPTPAVCGLPKDEAQRFILQNEAAPRRYYSGFVGCLDPQGDTRLYVSLRCMEILDERYRLYAGGGLLCESEEEKEWRETEAKLETMKRCIAIRETSTY